MRLEIEIDREPEDGRWIAEVLELPGCIVYAASETSALLKAQALALRVLADRLEHGEVAPELAEIAFTSRRHPSLKSDDTNGSSLEGPEALERLRVSPAELERLCRDSGVAELSLFGSVLRPDFRLDSDVDVLVTFLPDARVSLLDLARLQRRLGELFRRRVDLVPRSGLKPLVAQEVIPAARVIYAAGRGLRQGHPGCG